MEKKIDYSIVIPVYFNEENLWNTISELKKVVIDHQKELTGEIIFVDDGSGDNSYRILTQIKEKYPNFVKVIKLTRNFGQSSARTCGFDHAKGECIIHIAADLQDPPELINTMIDYFYKEGYDMVICQRSVREESAYRRFTSKMFYKIMQKLIFNDMPQGGFDFLLISKRVKETLFEFKESNPFFQGQLLWTGYKHKFIPYKRRKRTLGKSRWTFSKKIKMLIDGIMSYSYFPLRVMSIGGIIVSSLGFLYAIYILLAALLGRVQIEGWAPLMIVILVLSGIQMLMTGTIGEYLWRTLDQVRNRKLYIVDKILD